MKSFRLSEAEFNHVVSMIKIADRPLLSAKLFIVDGLPMGIIAEQLGVSREAVRKAILRVHKTWETFSGSGIDAVKNAAIGMLKAEMDKANIPDSWEPVVVYLPKNMANTIKNLEKDKLQELKNNHLESAS